ncbi:MAG: response regulator transcription factor [Polyangiaceae bacterium]|nr:response regulator transcription factor [Polyangiaceae bacterium]MBK8937856.1 response regulator transcription factor [Polyangiaceae bacterium]
MSDNSRLLVIDDDVELCELLAELLGQEGFTVEAVHDGAKGLARALSSEHALVILDVMLPGLTGFEVLSRLRKASQLPVLMLTARGEDIDRIVGLEMGADDYLPKPFNPRELVARVRAIHRRVTAVASPATETHPPIVVDDVELAPGARRVRVDGREVRLTTAEFDLLEALLTRAGEVISREDLTTHVLGRRLSAFDRAIDMHVSNLRKKLGPAPDGSERLKTVRNAGYLYVRSR